MMHRLIVCKIIKTTKVAGADITSRRELKIMVPKMVNFISGGSLNKILALEVKDTACFPEVFIIS